MEEASKETRASKEEALEEVEARHRNNTVRTIIPKIRAMSAPLGPIRRANAVPTWLGQPCSWKWFGTISEWLWLSRYCQSAESFLLTKETPLHNSKELLFLNPPLSKYLQVSEVKDQNLEESLATTMKQVQTTCYQQEQASKAGLVSNCVCHSKKIHNTLSTRVMIVLLDSSSSHIMIRRGGVLLPGA